MSEVTTNPAQAKFQLVTATALPHKCVGCGFNADGRMEFIDFGVSFDYEGAVQLCRTCGEAIARLVEFITTEERDQAIADQESAVAALEVEKEKVNGLSSICNTFKLIDRRILDEYSAASSIKQIEELRDRVSEDPSNKFA